MTHLSTVSSSVSAAPVRGMTEAGLEPDSSDRESESVFRQDMDALPGLLSDRPLFTPLGNAAKPSPIRERIEAHSFLDLQKERHNLSDRLQEERDFFAAAAQTFAISPTKGHRNELRRATRSVRGIYSALQKVIREMHKEALLNMTESEALDFCRRAAALYPGIAAEILHHGKAVRDIAVDALTTAEEEAQNAHV